MKTGGISGARLLVDLKSSENERLNYPCVGLLEIQEISVCGTIIHAVFRPYAPGQISTFVQVRNPVFEVGTINTTAMEILKHQPKFFD